MRSSEPSDSSESLSPWLTRSATIGIKVKVENKHQYQEYLGELKSLREELGVSLKEDLYPGVIFSSNRDKENWLPESESPQAL